jgi:hypothetical protein
MTILVDNLITMLGGLTQTPSTIYETTNFCFDRRE